MKSLSFAITVLGLSITGFCVSTILYSSEAKGADENKEIVNTELTSSKIVNLEHTSLNIPKFFLNSYQCEQNFQVVFDENCGSHYKKCNNYGCEECQQCCYTWGCEEYCHPISTD
jgi:hypothetical protein